MSIGHSYKATWLTQKQNEPRQLSVVKSALVVPPWLCITVGQT
jgi:hypothetical protein